MSATNINEAFMNTFTLTQDRTLIEKRRLLSNNALKADYVVGICANNSPLVAIAFNVKRCEVCHQTGDTTLVEHHLKLYSVECKLPKETAMCDVTLTMLSQWLSKEICVDAIHRSKIRRHSNPSYAYSIITDSDDKTLQRIINNINGDYLKEIFCSLGYIVNPA
ncbi:hypothetical protein [Shewanella aestuarii]|uniref:Uncharacterized protein n=1 Tax=Shewanella aestuarii TaxID=1028752 RepID=A0A6G9QPX5_9GAMM|nr:hypothetical protein [Shewanella aestuarii]QIR16616.1 hypothetical protein HBH39_19260 [Shewanella aestuarii]